MSELSLQEWQDKVVDWANRKGWWEEKDRNDGQLIALMHSEVSEAFEALINATTTAEDLSREVTIEDLMAERSPKDDQLPLFVEEAADVVIRIMDWAGHRGYQIPYHDASPSCPVDGTVEIEVLYLTNGMHRALTQVLEELRQPTVDKESIQLFLLDVVNYAMFCCQMCDWKLTDAIDAKMAINEKRAYRHGKMF